MESSNLKSPPLKNIEKLEEIRGAASNFNVTEEQLKLLDELAVTLATFESKRNSSTDFESFRSHIIDHELLRGYMGDDWVAKHLTEWGKKKNKSIEMFGEEENFREAKYFQRTRTLVEMLYNFQKVEGIKEKAKQLTTEDIESALAELEGAKMLLEAERRIRFIIPSGQRRADYDVDAYMSDGTIVACEMKCKIETTNLSSNTIFNTIDDARRKQLPEDRPGAVFIKIPGEWTEHSNFKWILSDGLEKALHKRHTPSVVYFHWEIWKPISSEDVMRIVSFGHYVNPNAHMKHPELEQLVKPSSGHYKSFSEIIP